MSADVEIISRAGLAAFSPWPCEDPRLRPQRCRTLEPSDHVILEECAFLHRLKLDRPSVNRTGLTVQDRIIGLLNHRAVQFNSRSRFSSSQVWYDRVTKACIANQPIRIVIPLFCVVANPVKRFTPGSITAGETVTLQTLANISDALYFESGQRVIFEIVSDSTFYAVPFNVNPVEAARYFLQLKREIIRLGLDDSVRLHDMSEVLATHSPDFNSRYERWSSAFTKDPLYDGTLEPHYHRWLESMRASINTSRFGWGYDELRQYFCGDRAGLDCDDLAIASRAALITYRSLKAAANEAGWEDLAFPGAIRATIHTKSSGALGLRVYPEYKFGSTLLPYHGMPLIGRHPKTGRHRMQIHPEMFLVSRDDIVRVIDDCGNTSFYHTDDGMVIGNRSNGVSIDAGL